TRDCRVPAALLLGCIAALPLAAQEPAADEPAAEPRHETRPSDDKWWEQTPETPADPTAADDAQAPLPTVPVNTAEDTRVPADTSSTRLDDIMVTSQKRVQSIQDVPISVTALTGQMLFEQAVTDVREALQLTPNARVDAAGFFSAPRVRGFTLNNNNKSFEPPVGMVFDGIPHARVEYFLAALMDTARIEVMRGPQGTTFGKNTTAGLIHLISNEPTSSPQGLLQIEGGDLERRRIEAAYGGPLMDGFNFRIAGLLDERAGFVENTTAAVLSSAPRDLKDRRRTGVRLTTEATDLWGSRLLLSYEASEMHDGGTGLETLLSGPNFQNAVRNYDLGADFIPGNWVASLDNPDFKDV
ncbi:MAG: TonB-dependent receptor plug domain-containing protein, partial [Hydrocarboniphaga effusa]|nr:TonB-dependent receptor plug domain-containing protein [Hydrocarboniphaga effusa]